MSVLKLGTRKSELAVAQAQIVKELIETKTDFKVELIKVSSIGDEDQISQLTRFRGQGVFTSTLEKALLENEIDLAVHSLKDLPIEDNDGLQIRAYIKRNHPGDSLLIKKSHLVNEDPLQIKDNSRFATGSPRRQSQLINLQPSAIPIDIRGNVNTRISRLETNFIDALIMATAVFERIDLELPDNVIKIDLPLNTFPGAPGQGVIAVQVRENELEPLSALNDHDSQVAATNERKILDMMGGGCELSLGLHIRKIEQNWIIYGSIAPDNWDPSKPSALTRYSLTSNNLVKLIAEVERDLMRFVREQQIEHRLKDRKIIVARSPNDAKKYTQLLEKAGAITFPLKLFDFQTKYHKLDNDTVKTAWEDAEWVVLSSQRAVEFLHLLHGLYPLSKRIATVGPATASKIRSYGLPVHLVAEGNVTSLQKLLREARKIYSGDVLFLSGQHITDLPSKDANRIEVYHSKTMDFEFNLQVDELVVFSTRSAEIIVNQLGKDCCKRWVALGESTASYLESIGVNYIVAESPTPKGIMDVIIGEQEQ